MRYWYISEFKYFRVILEVSKSQEQRYYTQLTLGGQRCCHYIGTSYHCLEFLFVARTI